MKTIIQIILFALVVNSLSAQVNCTLDPQYLDNNKPAVLDAWEHAGTSAFNGGPILPECGVKATNSENLPWAEYINGLWDPSKPCDGYYYIYFPAGVYIIYETLNLNQDNIILKGDGADYYNDPENTTKFIFVHGPGGAKLDCINISGNFCGIDDIYIKNVEPGDCIDEIPDHFINNTLNYTANYITGLNIQITDSQGKLISSGDAEIANGKYVKYICNAVLDQDELYTVRATFFFGSMSKTEVHFATVENGQLALPSRENSLDDFSAVQNTDTSEQGIKEKGEGYTIYISGDHNWVRGIYSEYTQKMHVYISGTHNTVTGCYFTGSWEYGSGGFGYGVCLSNARENLVENNVFYSLRHAMVCQFDTKLNVIAYNSSLNTQLYLGGDLLLHCNEGDAVGPMLNLMEGNIVERAKVDQKDENWHNDKFNTYFRNRAIYSFWISRVKKEYKERQCGQNVVGCNMDPNWDPWNGNTFHKLQKYGFSAYYDSGDAWEGLPSDQKSYFKQSIPAYYPSAYGWPFVPARSNVTPARDRQNAHNSNGVSPAVFQGLADYDLNCCDDLVTYSSEIWNNNTEMFKAMDEIIIDNCMVVSNNNLTFKAGSKITLTSGTHINSGNNVRIFYTNDICDWDKKGITKDFNDIDKIEDVESVSELAGHIRIFPNPNSGSFNLDTALPIQKENIHLYDLMGREIAFAYSNQSIDLLSQYKGVLIVHINARGEIVIKRIVIK
jgi:hypothetical protein